MIEKVSDEAFQSLWIEIQLPQKSNIICGIIYRQHNSPKRFQEYFDDKLERLITSNKSIYIMGDFNINLLHAETSCYAQDFLLSLQSFSFIPTIDKPTRVYNNSATLIDNILTNKVDVEITSGNIISDISDHYSQFCISHNFIQRPKPGKQTRRDFSGYSRSKFNSELSDALVSQIYNPHPMPCLPPRRLYIDFNIYRPSSTQLCPHSSPPKIKPFGFCNDGVRLCKVGSTRNTFIYYTKQMKLK